MEENSESKNKRDSPTRDMLEHETNKKDKTPIKSNSLVKFEACKVANFSRLQCNTDLNLPPSNWLCNDDYGLKQVISHSKGVSSFKMANMFQEMFSDDPIGDIDVISDAENIKRILKLPYSEKSVISMIVHRVNNTLLIDDFDIHKYFLMQASEDWDWLRKFIVDHVVNSMSEKERSVFLKSKGASRDMLQRMNLMSKFLYYSAKPEDEDSTAEKSENEKEAEEQIMKALQEQQHQTPLLKGPRLPDPATEEHLPRSQQHNRNVIWTFEDIRMLIGTDLPIFGNSNRPCITLRLRDARQPISVLTGIDCWLDNLMCNVPEVVMCYHLDGIVQKYELIKTEDLPYLEDSQFSPRIIRNVAQHILSFLKSKATKPGHTYWLFKGRNDDVVKLYDLTTLCKGEAVDKNPFTTPVAMLLYSVAKNIKEKTITMTPKTAGCIKSLLDNCIKLLPKEKYPQIVTSSHYMLSDLFVPSTIDPKAPCFYDEKQAAQEDSDTNTETSSLFDEEVESDPETDDGSFDLNLNKNSTLEHAAKSLKETLSDYNQNGNSMKKFNASPPPLSSTDVVERSTLALNHLASGLSCLQYFDTSEEEKAKEQEKQKRLYEEQNPNLANPFQPIPMPYETLETEDSRKNSSKKGKKGVKKQNSVEENDDLNKSLLPLAATEIIKCSWNTHLKLLLFEKACLVYVTKAEHAYANECYGVCLKFIYASIKCHQLIKTYLPDIKTERKNWLLGRAGDCFYQFSKNLDKFETQMEGFTSQSETDRYIQEELCKDAEIVEENLPKPSKNVEELLQTSCAFYEAACGDADPETRLEYRRRLASVNNDLGNRYMSLAQIAFDDYLKAQEELKKEEILPETTKNPSDVVEIPVYKAFMMKCYDAFNKGIVLFEEVQDSTNLILMLTNMGRFFRLRSHMPMPGETANDPNITRKFYNEAFSYYQRALGIVGSRKNNPELWELISWELSGATFNYAKTLQDYGLMDNRLSTEEIEHSVVEALQKALRLCQTDTGSTKQVLYTFRAGLIHHRLGSLYHNFWLKRENCDENKKKTYLTLCRMHYEKSAKIFQSLNETREFMEVQLKRVSVAESLTEATASPTAKIKHLLVTMDLLYESQPILQKIVESENLAEDLPKMLELFEQRLQICLRTLAKTYSNMSGKKGNEAQATLFKSMFGMTLRPPGKQETKELASHLNQVLVKLAEKQKSLN
ncbi:erythroid differentiation-related factor 1 [Culicoides brevitarsis]|uniref:erythroid differentiation-related factor 1 n=1 Tax=Culicoides brevitarsis TaxID=469753 RepID=UPI00307CB274